MKQRFKDLLIAIEQIDRHIGPWLFYVALVFTFVTTIFFFNKHIPESVVILTKRIHSLVPWLCYLRLGLLLPKNYKYVLMCLAILLFCGISWHFSGQKTLLNAAVILSASYGSNIRFSLKIFGMAISGILIIALSALCLGYTGDVQTHSFVFVGHSLGTINPNTLGCFHLLLTEVILLLEGFKSRKQICFICWAIGIATWFITLCTTTTIILLFFPLIYYIVENKKIPSYSYACIPWLLLFVSVVLMFYYGPSRGETTFESRFGMPAIAYEKYGLSWMGQYCGQIGGAKARSLGVEPFYIDNMYLRLFLYFGMIPGLLVMFFESHLLIRIAHRHEPIALSVAICSSLIALMEAYPLFVFNNIALLYYLDKEAINKDFALTELYKV